MIVRTICILAIMTTLVACQRNKNNQLLLHKKWRVYDVKIPPDAPVSNTQYIQAADLKKGYYKDVYYQFLADNIFVATIAGKPDTGKYLLLSNGKMIAITAANGDRKRENLVTIMQLTETNFDMKVTTADFQFILCTRKE